MDNDPIVAKATAAPTGGGQEAQAAALELKKMEMQMKKTRSNPLNTRTLAHTQRK